MFLENFNGRIVLELKPEGAKESVFAFVPLGSDGIINNNWESYYG
jgi:hypothetical protein